MTNIPVMPFTNITKPMLMLQAYILETDCDKKRLNDILLLQLEVNDKLLTMLESANEKQLENLSKYQSERRELIQALRNSKKTLFSRIFGNLI